MPQLGLALSGGGFRATLYHLGVIRFLKDSGQLHQVTDIASVSGGSILAAHMALNWDRYTGDDEAFEEAVREVINFVQFDVRNHIIRRLPMQACLRFLAKLTPLDGSRLTPNTILERYYRKQLYGDRRLYELPEQPALHILTTNISNGGLSVFNRHGLFIQQRGDNDNASFAHIPGIRASIARVVGASSAFPGLFPPVKITAEDIGVREGQFTTEWFTDGGVYDNLGIRAFSWLQQQDREFDQILVSDAGKPFQILGDASLGFVGQSMRATDILWDRVWQLERENFGKRDGFVFLPITEQVDLSEDPTVLHPIVQEEVQLIRTDLDCFSNQEINALAQHGYGVARKICRGIGLGDPDSAPLPPWAPNPENNSIAQTANTRSAKPSTPTELSLQLGKSRHRRTWSTLLSPRDWTSYVYVALALLIFGYFPLRIYELYRHSQVQATVIEAIGQGDPDIRQILELVDTDPTSNWIGETIEEKSEPTLLDYKGIEILSHSRIIDLRRWHPKEKLPDRRGRIYVRDRRTLKFVESYTGDRRVVFRNDLRLENVECRQLNSPIKGTLSRTVGPLAAIHENRTLYEIEYNLMKIPVEEPVTLEVETLATYPGLDAGRAPIVMRVKTDLLTIWMLFPEDRPYRKFSLVRYPADRSEPPEVMDARYTIDHPYGSLIGWSVVNPQIDTVYECRWTTE